MRILKGLNIYEEVSITGPIGLTGAKEASLRKLGAIDTPTSPQLPGN